MSISFLQKSYLAGFLDGDGSIYVRLKPNSTYKYGFQVAPYVVFFQSQKDEKKFESICSLVGCGHLRRRNDGILEYIISKQNSIRELLGWVKPYLLLKKEQADLMLEILDKKETVESKNDFIQLIDLVDKFRDLNYSKKRKKYTLTP